MTPDPFLHADSGAVRFWVPVGGQLMGASVSVHTLHWRYAPQRTDDDAMETFRLHREDLFAAVRRRVAGGSIEPVMLREYDLAPARSQDTPPAER